MPFKSAMEKSTKQMGNVDSDKMVAVFSLMCPGISGSTLAHDIRLLDSLKFKQICNRVTVTIEYDPVNTDVRVIDNKLVERTNENGYSREQPYSSYSTYMPPLKPMTDLVGDTDIIGSFLEAHKITEVTWLHWSNNTDWIEDISVSPWTCTDTTLDTYQCVPAHQHVPRYIFTPYPEPVTGLTL